MNKIIDCKHEHLVSHFNEYGATEIPTLNPSNSLLDSKGALLDFIFLDNKEFTHVHKGILVIN